jgi:HEAT repeat protein
VRTLSFFAGLFFAVFGLLIAQNFGLMRFAERPHPPREVPGPPPPSGAGRERGRPDDRAGEEEIAARIAASLGDPRGKTLDPLAVALEEALYDNDWAKVQAVASVIRARGAEWVAPPVAPAPVPGDEKTLFDELREIERRIQDRQLAQRRNAATALGGRTDARTIAQLYDLVETSRDEVERGDAATLIARSGDEAGLRALVAALRSPRREVRIAAGEALAREGYREGALEAAAILRNEADRDFHGTALHCVALYEATQRGEPQHPATAAFLEALRQNRSPEIRRAAAVRLARMDLEGGRVLADALYEALDDDDAESVRAEAMESLWRYSEAYGPPFGAIERVSRALASEPSAAVRARILEWLAIWGDANALTAIDEFAATPAARENAERLRATRDAVSARVQSAPAR